MSRTSKKIAQVIEAVLYCTVHIAHYYVTTQCASALCFPPTRDDDMPVASSIYRGQGARAEFGEVDDMPLGMEEGREDEGEGEEEEAARINVDIPRCVAQLGTELYFVKLPNFLSVETRQVELTLCGILKSFTCV